MWQYPRVKISVVLVRLRTKLVFFYRWLNLERNSHIHERDCQSLDFTDRDIVAETDHLKIFYFGYDERNGGGLSWPLFRLRD